MSTLEQEKEFSQTAYRLMLDYARTAWGADTAAPEVMAQMLATVMIARAQDSIAATGIAQNRAEQRMAEAAERQAAAMERANEIAQRRNELLEGLPPVDLSGPIQRIVDAIFGIAEDDQRAEDNASYNAGIAPGLHQ